MKLELLDTDKMFTTIVLHLENGSLSFPCKDMSLIEGRKEFGLKDVYILRGAGPISDLRTVDNYFPPSVEMGSFGHFNVDTIDSVEINGVFWKIVPPRYQSILSTHVSYISTDLWNLSSNNFWCKLFLTPL